MEFIRSRNWCVLLLSGLFVTTSSHAATVLFNETFDGITTGYTSESYGWFCCHYVQHGVPTTGAGSMINGGADEDWYGVRFDSGGKTSASIKADIGTQDTGGPANDTPVGLLSNDAGLMFRIDATGYQNLTLTFDWTTFAASGDKVTVGYFIGDLLAGHPDGLIERTLDARNELAYNSNETPDRSDLDGPWNWKGDALNAGNEGDWTQLMHSVSDNLDWHFDETFNLTGTDGQEIWVAFWLDNGNDGFGKIDNITVMASPIPVPPAVWLFGSGLIGLVGIARKKRAS